MYLYLGRHLFNHYDYEKNLYQYVPVQKFVHFDGKKAHCFCILSKLYMTVVKIQNAIVRQFDGKYLWR